MRADDGRMVPTFIRQALAGEPITVTGTASRPGRCATSATPSRDCSPWPTRPNPVRSTSATRRGDGDDIAALDPRPGSAASASHWRPPSPTIRSDAAPTSRWPPTGWAGDRRVPCLSEGLRRQLAICEHRGENRITYRCFGSVNGGTGHALVHGGISGAGARDQRGVPRLGRRPGGRRSDRGRRRGRTILPPQARQAAGAVLGLGAARGPRSAGAWPRPVWSPADLDAVGYSYDPRLVATAGVGAASTPAGSTCAPGTPGGAPFFRSPCCRTTTPAVSISSATTSPTPPRPAWGAASGTARCWWPTAAARRPRCWRGVPRRKLDILAAQTLPHSLGLLYEDLTAHLGFERSSDEYKVMALASYGTPRLADGSANWSTPSGDGGFRTEPVDWLDSPRRGRRRTAALGDRPMPTWPPASRPCSRRCCSSCAAGCTARTEPEPGAGRRHRAELRGQHPAARRGRLPRRSGCSRPPATPAPPWVPR